MPDPPKTKRQQIVDLIKARLSAITVENEYQTNLGWNGGTSEAPIEVDEWPTQYQEEELSAGSKIGIFDLTQSKAQSDIGQKGVVNEMPCQVRIFHKRGTTPAQLRVMIGDVERALITDPESGHEDPTLAGVAVSMFSDEVGFIVPNDSFQVDGAAVQFKVFFLTNPFNAYE